VLVGVVGPGGRLGYVTPALAVDAQFVARTRLGRPPESRFRFAEPCVEARCAQWAGDRCGLIAQLLASPRGAEAASRERGRPLPRCAIRRSCRWFAERGPEACAICPHVVHTRRVPAGQSPRPA
jgi:hypothetical protein